MDLVQPSVERDTPKPRAIVFGGGIGMFPPFLQRFKDEFDIVAVIGPELPRVYRWMFLLRSFRLPKDAWYREWRRYVEHTPFSFRAVTKKLDRELAKYEGKYDCILFFGAMSAPGYHLNKKMFVFTDSCRWLSSRNQYDESCHFRSEHEEKEWLQLEGNVYRSASRVFVGSDFVKNAIVDAYSVPSKRVIVAGLGAGIGFGEHYEKHFDGRTILYIGKGDFEKKGGLILLKAFEQVRRALPDTVLHVVGQERLPVLEGVISHGFVRDRDRIVALMRSAHVFTLPSLVDRNPITILEAMATATPCVASDYGAMPEIVGDAGLIAPCGDHEKLAESLIKLLTNTPLATRLGVNGRQRFEKKYNWDSIWKTMRSELLAGLHE